MQNLVIIFEDFILLEEVEVGFNQLFNCGGDIVVLEFDSISFLCFVCWEWIVDCIEFYFEIWVLVIDCFGFYIFIVINLDNGCQGSDIVRVNVVFNFSQVILLDMVYFFCELGEVMLDNSGSIGILFSWFRDGINISLFNN